MCHLFELSQHHHPIEPALSHFNTKLRINGIIGRSGLHRNEEKDLTEEVDFISLHVHKFVGTIEEQHKKE